MHRAAPRRAADDARRGDSDKNSEIEFKEFIAALATFHAGSKEDKLKCKRAAATAAAACLLYTSPSPRD